MLWHNVASQEYTCPYAQFMRWAILFHNCFGRALTSTTIIESLYWLNLNKRTSMRLTHALEDHACTPSHYKEWMKNCFFVHYLDIQGHSFDNLCPGLCFKVNSWIKDVWRLIWVIVFVFPMAKLFIQLRLEFYKHSIGDLS